MLQLPGRPPSITEGHQDVVGAGAIAVAQSLQDILGSGQPDLPVHRQRGLPAPHRPMQDETAIYLYRAAEVYRQAPEGPVLQRNLDLLEQ